mmetsp:Transcript_17608/g.40734  ORF Transcript_17608/g.40734 Transcript_17608/m.40734 type:complete len:875 (+) Transcript_17608:147-2771(+)
MANAGSLIRLFQSEYFNAHLHMQYLHEKNEPGVQDYLVNELFKMTDDEVDFYLPQLCHAAVVRYNRSSLHRFLLDKAAKSMHFALKVYWLVQSTVEDKLPELVDSATSMAGQCMSALATSPVLVTLPHIGTAHAALPAARKEQAHAAAVSSSMEDLMLSSGAVTERAVPSSILPDDDSDSGGQANLRDSLRKCHSNSELPEPSTPLAQDATPLSDGKEKISDITAPVPAAAGQSASYGSAMAHLRTLGESCTPKNKFESVGLAAHLPNLYAELGSPVPDGTAEGVTSQHQPVVIRRRCEWFKMQKDFVSVVTKLSTSIVATPDKAERKIHFKKFLSMLNSWMLQRRLYMALNAEGPLAFYGLHFPMLTHHDTNLQMIRVVVDECRLFSSATRAPFLVTYEVANLDEVHAADVSQMNRIASRGNTIAVPHMASESQIPFAMEGIEDPDSMVVLSRSVIAMLHSCVTAELDAAMQPGESSEDLPEQTSPDEAEHAGRSGEVTLHAGQMQALREKLTSISSEDWLTLEPKIKLQEAAPNAVEETYEAVMCRACRRAQQERKVEAKLNAEGAGGVASCSECQKCTDAPKVRQEIWGELWAERVQRIRQASPYGHYSSWAVHGAVVKGGDDLRQELLASQVIKQFSAVWKEAGLPLWLRDMEVLVVSSSAGFIEFISDAQALDGIKKSYAPKSLAEIFNMAFADRSFEAKKNFIESIAAYNLVVYFLQVKDRHNGNLMLDSDGHIVHIDFGFMLSNSPGGNTNFEQSPFKLTQEFLDVMDGEHSEQFEYFRTLLVRGFLEARKHVDRIILPIRMMLVGSKFPCFREGPERILKTLQSRFLPNMPEEVCVSKILDLIDLSVNNWRTKFYDDYQWIANGIH